MFDLKRKVEKSKELLKKLHPSASAKYYLVFNKCNNFSEITGDLQNLKSILDLRSVLKISIYSSSITSSQLSGLLLQCPSLVSLRLTNCTALCTAFLEALSRCVSLKSFVLTKEVPSGRPEDKVGSLCGVFHCVLFLCYIFSFCFVFFVLYCFAFIDFYVFVLNHFVLYFINLRYCFVLLFVLS